jgi:hypothetical protein
MADHANYSSYKDYLRENFLNETVQIHQKMPIPGQGGGVSFPGIPGALLGVFDDGIAIRAEHGEVFFQWADVYFITCLSKISLATGSVSLKPGAA